MTETATTKKTLPFQDNIEPSVQVIEMGEATRSAWEAFIFFGAGRMDEFKATAFKAKEKAFDSGYAMLLGLARIEGDKAAFEDLAVDYAVQYGQSPPAWFEGHTRQNNPARTAFEVEIESLSEDTILEVTVKLESPRPLVMDLKKVQRVDATGVEIFNECLALRMARGGKTELTNGDKLVKGITAKIKAAPEKSSTGLWEFCFNYWKLKGAKDSFTQAAATFAQLGGEAPTWVDLSESKGPSAEGKSTQGYKAPERLSGMTGDSARVFLATPDGARARTSAMLLIDMADTRQGSLHDAAEMFAFLKVFASQNIKLSLINVNEIFAAMFQSMAIDHAVESVAAPGLAL